MIYSDGQNVIKGAWASRPHSKLERRQENLSVLSRREFDSQPLQTQSLRKGLPLNDMLSSWGYCPVRLTFQPLQFSGGAPTAQLSLKLIQLPISGSYIHFIPSGVWPCSRRVRMDLASSRFARRLPFSSQMQRWCR